MAAAGWVKRGLLALLLVLIASCEPEPTPLPVAILPASTEAPAPTDPAQIRYAIAPNAAGLIPDLALIDESARVEYLSAPPVPEDLGARYDLVVALGDLPEGTRAPSLLTVSLIINPALPPLDDAAARAAIASAVAPPALVTALAIPGAQPIPLESSPARTVRDALANAGYPDGFDVTLAAFFAPGADALAAQLATVGIQARIVAADSPVDAHLSIVTDADSRDIAPDNRLDLFTVPISYRAAPGIAVDFTPSGFPIAQR